MKQATGNMFHAAHNHTTGKVIADAICITTNGFVKRCGECVMGRGCAREVIQYDNNSPRLLGKKIRLNGNITQVFNKIFGVDLVAFPVKPAWREFNVAEDIVKHMRHKFSIGDKVPGWASTAIPELIRTSAEQLVTLANKEGWTTVFLPRPGCGAGELSWEEICPVLSEILDDRFTVFTFN